MNISQNDYLETDSVHALTIKKIPFYKSLIGRTVIVLVVVLIVLFGVDSWFRFGHIRGDMESQFMESASQTADITAEALSQPVWDFNKKQIKEQMEALQESELYCGAEITDVEGTAVFNDSIHEQNQQNITLNRDITFNKAGKDNKIASMSLCFRMGKLQEHIEHEMTHFIAYQIIIAAFIISMASLSVLRVTTPLKKLRYALRDIAPDLKPITDPDLMQDNEIGRVTAVLNHELKQLSHSRKMLQKAKSLADAASTTKTEFIANMSHELRTPLNAIIGFSEIISMDGNNGLREKYKEYISGIYSSGIHLLDIINGILEFSQIDYELANVSTDTIKLDKFVKKLMNSVTIQAEEAGVNLHVQTVKDITIYADERKLKRAITNVLSNAVKFTAHGKDVYFNVKHDAEGNMVIFEIEDSGIGMAEEDLPRLFQPFTQLDSKLARRYEGTGLGLFISKKFVECLGGNMSLASTVGVGTKVYIAVPILQNY